MNLTITKKAGHLAWCALIALRLAQRDGIVHSDVQKNLFLTRWLATAQKQRRFCKDVATDIEWLLKQSRKLGVRAKLPQKLEYLYRSCTGKLCEQTDLFRLTYAFETSKKYGFYYQLLSEKEWITRCQDVSPAPVNAIYLTKTALENAFDETGKQTDSLAVKISGDIGVLREILRQCGWACPEHTDCGGRCSLQADNDVSGMAQRGFSGKHAIQTKEQNTI